jgi:hypothetical protein
MLLRDKRVAVKVSTLRVDGGGFEHKLNPRPLGCIGRGRRTGERKRRGFEGRYLGTPRTEADMTSMIFLFAS